MLNIVSNGGSVKYDTMEHFALMSMSVHFNEHSLANVLSYAQISNMKNVRITTDTAIQKAIFVHISHTDGIILLKFQECRDGLYNIDMKISILKIIKLILKLSIIPLVLIFFVYLIQSNLINLFTINNK